MTVVLETSESSRNPMTIFAALFTVGALGIAAYHHAPWYIWAIWGPCAGLLVWMVVVNKVKVFQVCTDRLCLGDGRTWTEVALSDIARIDITTWSDGADTGVVVLNTGAKVRLNAGTIPQAERLAQALSGYDITVLRDRTPIKAV